MVFFQQEDLGLLLFQTKMLKIIIFIIYLCKYVFCSIIPVFFWFPFSIPVSIPQILLTTRDIASAFHSELFSSRKNSKICHCSALLQFFKLPFVWFLPNFIYISRPYTDGVFFFFNWSIITITMLCWFLLYINMNQSYVYIYPLPPEPPSSLSRPSGHYRALSWTACVIQQLPTVYLFYTW